MADQERNLKQIRIFGRNFEIDIDFLSSVNGLLSTAIAVIALLFGVYQFRKGIEMTESQIQFMKDEKIERNEENRPILRTSNFNVYSTSTDWWFKVKFTNEGKREADSVIYENTVLSYDGNENLSNSYIVPIFHRVVRAQGLLTQDTLRDNKSFKRIDEDVYLVRFVLLYRDKLTREAYPLVKYYKIDLKYQPAYISEYYDDQKHSNAKYHEEFHKVFDLYFDQNN